MSRSRVAVIPRKRGLSWSSVRGVVREEEVVATQAGGEEHDRKYSDNVDAVQ